jgi:hypothetical protein
MIDTGSLVYRCSPAIAWVKDAGQTLLVQEEKKCWWSLHGIEAVIWDLGVLAYPFHKIVRFMSILLGSTMPEAEEILGTILHEWVEKGILCVEEGD